MIAAIFAAAMSTVSTSLNSAATLIMSDFYKRLKKYTTDKQCINVLHIATIVFGVAGSGAAFIMSKFGEGFGLWQTLAGIFSGGMLGLFILGRISEKAGNAVGVIGTLSGIIAIIWMTISKSYPDFFGNYSYTWNRYLIPVIGTTMILFVGLALSRIKGLDKKNCNRSQGMNMNCGSSNDGKVA